MITSVIWCTLKVDTRNKLREIFKIPRSGTNWVRDNVLISDGTTDQDLKSLTGQALADFVGQEGTIDELFLKAIEMIEHNIIMSPVEAPETATKPPELPKNVPSSQNEIKTEIKGFVCGKCGKEYKQAKRLINHKLKEHKNE